MKLGIVGWRGMVGSVLMDRMSAEKDFELVDTTFFSTSNAGGAEPAVPRAQGTLKNADDIPGTVPAGELELDLDTRMHTRWGS